MTGTDDNTPTRWERLLSDLCQKAATTDEELKKLAGQRDELLLDAELGTNGAPKKLTVLDAALALRYKEYAQTKGAIQQAERRLVESKALEARAQEAERIEELRLQAQVVLRHARAVTGAMRTLVREANAVRDSVSGMIGLAKPDEMPSLNRILSYGPLMRAAEHEGMREVLEFASYPGPKEHLGPLETELTIHLSRWIPPQTETETNADLDTETVTETNPETEEEDE